MESLSNKKRKRTLDHELNTARNSYYKKLRKEQKKKKRTKQFRTNESKNPPANDTKKVATTQQTETATKEKKKDATSSFTTQLNIRRDATSRGMMMVAASLQVSKEIGSKENGRKLPDQAPSSKRRAPNVTDMDLTELKNVKRVPGARALGSGTFGTCYPGTFRQFRVVLKEYKVRSRTEDEDCCLELLRREARREARVIKELGDHPGIPWLFGVCTVKMPVSIVLKFHSDGDDSWTIYKSAKGKKVAERKEWKDIFVETADALLHIHDCGYAHNDLKTNNVVLEKREDEQLHPVIIDFGKSVLLRKAKAPVAKAVCVGKTFKNSHVAPELIDGSGKPSIESDVYALGFLIKSVCCILEFQDIINVNVTNALAKSPKNRPTISVLKAALIAEN